MFTRVFYWGIAHGLFSYSSISPTTTIKNYMGESVIPTYQVSNVVGNFTQAINNPLKDAKSTVTTMSYCIAFGNGDAAPTLDDHQLSGEHFTTYNVTMKYDYSAASDEAISSVTYTFTNTGDSAFTIREAGVFINVGTKAQSHRCLVWREVLDSPVTIEAGGVGQVTLTFKVNIPEA